MRRFLALPALLAVVAAAATGAPATAATSHPPKPQLHDAAGDWKVPSQDILDATVTATAKEVRADLHLSAAPATGIPGIYDVAMYAGCTLYSLHFTWTGGLPGSKATLDQYACDTGDATTDELNGLQPVASTPATATVTSTGLRIVAAPTGGLHRGARVSLLAEARAEPVIVFSPGTNLDQPSYGGDIGIGNGAFRLGS
jgi:hypothetical protein